MLTELSTKQQVVYDKAKLLMSTSSDDKPYLGTSDETLTKIVKLMSYFEDNFDANDYTELSKSNVKLLTTSNKLNIHIPNDQRTKLHNFIIQLIKYLVQ